MPQSLRTVCHTVDFGEPAGREDFYVYGRYTDLKPLGSGGYGFVVSAMDHNDGFEEEVVIKKLPTIFKAPSLVKAGLREVTLLLFFVHDNILSLRDLILPLDETPDGEPYFDSTRLEDHGLYLVLDKMTCDLGHLIYSDVPLPVDVRRLMVYQILRGLKCIHSARVLHRDLKPQNILVNEDCDVKICDFGLARDYESNGMTTFVATQFYRAPELLLELSKGDESDPTGHTIYTEAVDVWSVGCIMAELILRQPLFNCASASPAWQISTIFSLLGRPAVTPDMSPGLAAFLTAFRGPDHPSRSWEEVLSDDCDPLERDLISRMVVFDPARRLSVVDALAHPFLEELHDLDDEPSAPAPYAYTIHHPEAPHLDMLSYFSQMHPEVRSLRGWPTDELPRCPSTGSLNSDLPNRHSFLNRSVRFGRFGSVRHAFAEANAASFMGAPGALERGGLSRASEDGSLDSPATPILSRSSHLSSYMPFIPYLSVRRGSAPYTESDATTSPLDHPAPLHPHHGALSHRRRSSTTLPVPPGAYPNRRVSVTFEEVPRPPPARHHAWADGPTSPSSPTSNSLSVFIPIPSEGDLVTDPPDNFCSDDTISETPAIPSDQDPPPDGIRAPDLLVVDCAEDD